MRNKYKSIICSLLLCSTLSSSYAASDDCVDAYTPGTSSKMGLLKTAIVGVALMAMPRPVDSSSNGFVGCYRGTIDTQKSISTNTIAINTISYSPCSYGPLHSPTSDFKTKIVDMKMTVIPTDGEDARVQISNIEFAGKIFGVYYAGIFNWQPATNMSLNRQFFLNVYRDSYTSSGDTAFNPAFSAFMKS